MAKYMDSGGLSYFISKLKTWAVATFAPLSHTHDYTKTRVKGDAESSYRTGDVNLTPANIGAVAKSGDTMTGALYMNMNTNKPYFRWNKGGSYWHAIGYNGVTNETQFGPADTNGNWVDADTEAFKIKGNLKTTKDVVIADHVTQQYNTTTQALDFIFS